MKLGTITELLDDKLDTELADDKDEALLEIDETDETDDKLDALLLIDETELTEDTLLNEDALELIDETDETELTELSDDALLLIDDTELTDDKDDRLLADSPSAAVGIHRLGGIRNGFFRKTADGAYE